MKNRQTSASNQNRYTQFEGSKMRPSSGLKIISSTNLPHGGQYWWCCQCGVCNEGSYCYKESCGHEQCSSCQI